MASHIIIPPEYRVNIYLDTNILVDYIERTFPLLNESIKYLSECPYVNLKSSHYVLFEYTEVRKFNLFRSICEKEAGIRYMIHHLFHKRINKSYVKHRSWKIFGIDYNNVKSDISETIANELNTLRDDLNLDFNEHVLHDALIAPTNNLCLSTKISKEDCLIMISCMHPQKEEKLEQCILLSRDGQYNKAYNENKTDVEKIFHTNKLSLPCFKRTANLIDKQGKHYNLYSKTNIDIKNIWNEIILESLKSKLNDSYIGETYAFGDTGTAANCIYFKLKDKNEELRESAGLLFIPKNLSNKISIAGPFEFWNKQKISLPYRNPDFPKYSFLPKKLNPETLQLLRKDGNLVFYEDY